VLETLSNHACDEVVCPPVGGPRDSACTREEILRHLERGDVLFQKGDTRAALYQVQSGSLCHYIVWEDGPPEVIEFAFPGDIVGLGAMEHHVSTAQAMTRTTLRLVSPPEFERRLDADGQLAARLAAAIDREFDVLKARAIRCVPAAAEKRLAALLVAISGINASEGRDPARVGDEVSSAFVADQLGLSLEDVTDALVSLRKRGFITAGADDLRLVDIAGLERLSAAA
jgi:CRP/FNR family transcriptional regulator